MPEKKATIRDVARHAGVSVATVSNVINNINKTSQITRDNVLKSIKDLNYHIDYTARSLASKKSNLIGIILPLKEEGDTANMLIQENPFYSEFVSSVEYIARKKGYDVLITGVLKKDSCREWILRRNVDGVIFLGIYHEMFFKEVKELNIPIVLIDTYEKITSDFFNIGIDDVYGGYIATKHLLALGHKNIALVIGHDMSKVHIKRLEGYKKALKEYNVEYDKNLVFETNKVSFDGGLQLGKNILKKSPNITAVFASADVLAVGLIKAFKECNKNIPKDISIVGFDDIDLCKYFNPTITTVKQDIFEKGINASKAIINEIEKKHISNNNRNILLDLSLIIRESTASPNRL